MSNLIDRQAAFDICNNAIDLWEGQIGEGALIAVKDKIAKLPSAEPERKKGQWIWCISSDHLKCSECGTRAPMYMDYANGDYQEWLSDICPECGCEMKGLEEDE